MPRESPENKVGDAILGLRNCVITSELRYSSLKITSMYARFAREKKRAMAEKLLGTPSPFLPMSVIRGYNPIGGGDTSEACVKEVSARTERRGKQTGGILSELHYETLLWIAERVAAEHRRTNPTFTPLTVASKYRH